MDDFSDSKSKTYLNNCNFVFEQIVRNCLNIIENVYSSRYVRSSLLEVTSMQVSSSSHAFGRDVSRTSRLLNVNTKLLRI